MGARRTIRNGLLIGLVLFVLFSKPFLGIVMLREPLKGDELKGFVGDYSIQKPFLADYPAESEVSYLMANMGVIDILRMFLDPRVNFVAPALPYD